MAHHTGRPVRTPRRRRAGSAGIAALAAGVLLAGPLAACGDDDDGAATSGAEGGQASDTTADAAPVIDPGDGGDYQPALDPAQVVPVIDNPYLPFTPGSRWVYEGTDDGEEEHIEVVVTDQRRRVMGIDAVVVRDIVSTGGEVIEDTYDWYVQDTTGNVWYLGEETAEYEDGEVVSTEGSWEAGVDGALPGIVMQAQPEVGQAYRQEFYEGEAEDLAEVARLGEQETVAGTAYDQVVVIEEWNPLEPEVVEEKFYAPGVGTILEVKTAGGEGRVELVEYTPAP
jgi:hypothetical protein